MNLYAIIPTWAPLNEPHLILAKDDQEATDMAVFDAAHDAAAPGGYGSPSADVYLIARDLKKVGTSWATDAPPEWRWAHPAVEENAAMLAALEAAHDAGLGHL